jgi:cysteine desulfurase
LFLEEKDDSMRQMKSPLTSDLYYFDYNATHPPIPEVLSEALGEYQHFFFNPSGATRYSLASQGKIESVRKIFAKITNTNERDLVFSSTGTEANYLMIRALRSAFPDVQSVIVSPFEHSSMYEALADHHFQIRILKTNLTGLVSLSSLEALLTESKSPIVCLAVGNETGVIQPTAEISKMAKDFDVPFLSDLMQGFGKIEMDFDQFDSFTFSSHKIGGGMGSAITRVISNAKEYRLFGGGNQENSHRAGTENLQSILAFAKASEFQLLSLVNKNQKLVTFQKEIENQLTLMGCKIVAQTSPRIPNTSYVILPIDDLDFFLLGMEEKGFIISTGSSCKSRAREASSSLLAMGFTKDEALRAIRISTGIYTQESDVNALCFQIKELLTTFGT